MTRERALGLLGFVGGEPTSEELEMLYSRKNRDLADRLRSAPNRQTKEKIIAARENLAEALAVLTGQPIAPRESAADEPPPGAVDEPVAPVTPSPQAPIAHDKTHPARPLDPDVDLTHLVPEQVLEHRYGIRRRLGQGSVGVVYAAYDGTREEEVAIKVVQPQLLLHPEARNRFLAAGKTASRLSHPNIVKVHDVQKSEKGAYFITMELVRGHSLRQHMIDRRQFPVLEVRSAAKTLANALTYVHQLTIHGDLKPENVWVEPAGTLKLMDVGITQLLDHQQMSMTSRMLGKAVYLAPEQHRDDWIVDHRADQYALAAILYEMLVGKPPAFDVVPPVASLRGDVPKPMSQAIARALSPNPDDRFEDVQDFLVALNAPRRGMPWRKLGAAAVIALVVAGAVATSDEWLPEAREMFATRPEEPSEAPDGQGDIPEYMRARAALPSAIATQPTTPFPASSTDPPIKSTPAKSPSSEAHLAAIGAQEHWNAAIKNLKELSARSLVVPAEEVAVVVTAAEQSLQNKYADHAMLAMKQGEDELSSGRKVASDEAFEKARTHFNDAASGAIGAAAMVEAWAMARSAEMAAQGRIKSRQADALAGLALFRQAEARRLAGDFSAAQSAYQDASGRWQAMTHVTAQAHEKANSLFEQGQRALFGQGVPQSDAEAARLFSEAVAEGSIDAIPPLADLLLEGRGIKADPNQAASLLRRGVEAGSVPATARLGKMYLEGTGVVADPGEGLRLIRQAAEHDATAMGLLGAVYAEGKYVTRDDAQAMKLLTASTETDPRPQGETMYWLGILYRDGRGTTVDREKAERWLTRAADVSYIPAMVALGDLYASGETPDGAKAVGWYARAAESSAATDETKRHAAYRAGEAYENGLVGEPDPAKARDWYQKAAALNDTKAMRRLATMHRNGLIGGVDAKQARLWVEKAAQAGDAEAMMDLAQMNEQGLGGAKDANAAMAWYRKAADAGHVPAMVRLADRLSAGTAPAAMPAEAVTLYTRAANAGSTRAAVKLASTRLAAGDPGGARQWLSMAESEPEAMFMIGEMHAHGVGTPADSKQATTWYRRAADAGNRAAMRALAGTMRSTDPAEAVRWYRHAAELGDPVAMNELALCMQHGRGMRADAIGAVRWLKRSADAGNADAMYHLARTYELGDGVTKDPHQARAWAESAAKGGQVEAMHMLGQIFYNGTIGAPDYAKAAEWYRSAAEKGNAPAMYALGKMYYDGVGVSRDRAAAAKWMRLAAKAGEDDAAAKLRAWGMTE